MSFREAVPDFKKYPENGSFTPTCNACGRITNNLGNAGYCSNCRKENNK